MKITNFNPNYGFNITQGLASGSNTTPGVSAHSLLTGLSADDHSAYVLNYDGGEEVVQNHGSAGTTETFDLANGNYHVATLNANCTFTFTAVTSGVLCSATLALTQDGTGGRTITLPASFANKTALEAAQVTTASTVTFLVVWTIDGGTTWYGQWAGGAASVSFATPAIVLGSSAAAGAASTVIRSDSTIAAFDATVPVTQAFGDSAATGSVAFAARRDHKHGMPVATDVQAAALSHVHVAYEVRTADGSTTTWTLDQTYEPGSVMAWNRTTGTMFGVTEVLPDQATLSAAGTAADTIDFHYAAAVI